ncbi:MAG TPA: AI-2E family transporter [Clostridiales bacterium]|nr:AI-2E family transporter [Clostridiales bacterium]
MKFKFNSKYTTIAIYVVIVFVICLLFVSMVFNYEKYIHYVKLFLKVLSPVIWGGVIAYLLNPIMKFFEKLLKKVICKKKERKSLVRSLSITITMLITLSLIALLIMTVIPEVMQSIEKILKNFSSYLNNLQNFATRFLSNNPEINELWNEEFETIRSSLMDAVTKFKPEFEKLLTGIKDGAFSFLIGIKDFLLGLIMSIYVMYNKETFKGQTKKVLYSLLHERKCEKILRISDRVNTVFIKYISGKTLDSLIVGVITFIGMTIMGMPFAALISFIIGLANMIPFFGPIIGAIPCILLILVEDPKKAIIFAIFILVLQQFDGNVLEPKILGGSLGLPTFWILFAIFVGGGLFGFIGMVTFVPIFTVIYTLIKEFLNEKLEKKNLPTDTGEYIKSIPVSVSTTDCKTKE